VKIVEDQRVTFEPVLGHLRKRDFAVLSTVGNEGRPPEHADGTVHVTKADAQASTEHFDGKTTE
jgi:hypothetical protein